MSTRSGCNSAAMSRACSQLDARPTNSRSGSWPRQAASPLSTTGCQWTSKSRAVALAMRFVTTPLLCTKRISLGRPIAQAIQEKVEQAAGLVALFGRAGDERDPADAEHHVGSVDIASQLSLCSARFQQRVNALEQAFATLGEWVAPRCDHRSQSLRHPMFGCQVVDEAIHPRSQCDVGRHRLQQFRNTGAEPCQLVAVRGFDESLTG